MFVFNFSEECAIYQYLIKMKMLISPSNSSISEYMPWWNSVCTRIYIPKEIHWKIIVFFSFLSVAYVEIWKNAYKMSNSQSQDREKVISKKLFWIRRIPNIGESLKQYGKNDKMKYNKGTFFSLLFNNQLYPYRMRKTWLVEEFPVKITWWARVDHIPTMHVVWLLK